MKKLFFTLCAIIATLSGKTQEIIYENNFTDNSSNWAIRNDENVYIQVESGKYIFEHKRENGAWISWKEIDFDSGRNFSISCQTMWIDGIDNNSYEILWGEMIVYYAGHGVPDERTKSAYLLPVDGNSQNTATAIKLSDIYANLTEHPSASLVVFLDACFSGSSRNDQTLAQARGVKIKPQEDALNNNLVVFSAATGDETAFPLENERHGIFTFYLLQELQNTGGHATLEELGNHVIKNVARQSIVVNKKMQTPQIRTNPSFGSSWKNIRLTEH